MAIPAIISALLLAAVAYLIYSKNNSPKHAPLPPGPKPLPVLGNIRDFPPDGEVEYEHWLKHKDLYGPISSVTVMGMTLVPIHDKKMAHEILEQHASKTSGRPSMIMANKLCGYERIVLCQGYNPTFKRYRKFLHQELGTKASASHFEDAQEGEVKKQLVRALNRPDQWLSHFKKTAAATVLKMTYGYTIEPHKPDTLVDTIEQMMKEFSLAAAPMAWAVDIIPALRHLPESFPGATFHQTARKWRKSIQASAYIPYRFVQRLSETNSQQPSYVSKHITQLKQDSQDGTLTREDEDAVLWTAASLYGAGADTTVITLSAFTLAMIQFPEVQRRAQEEIDRVVGTDRLPTFEDRDSLPYCNAIVKEATRWWPISPMGFPHTTTEGFEYNGHYIPEGAFLLPAVWWFLHDPDTYADPDTFDPSRFLEPRNEPDPTTEAFGYGRRICPGRFFADSSLFINMVQSLACFRMSEPDDASGSKRPSDVKPKPGILTYPTEFDCKVEPRSEKHVALIRALEKEDLFEPSDAHMLDKVEDFEVMY